MAWHYFQQAGEDQKIKEIFFDNKWEEMFKAFPTDKPEADVYREAREYYGKELMKYYLKSKKNHSEFPQYTTLDQTYRRDQFKTFVDLGYHVVRNELNVQLRKDL